MNKMILKNFTESTQHNQNGIKCIGPHNKKNNLKLNSESLSYCYNNKNTNVMFVHKKEKVTAKKSWEWQNILIFRHPFNIQEEVKFLPTNWIKRNDKSSGSMMNRGDRL
jgi:hypothetical protein